MAQSALGTVKTIICRDNPKEFTAFRWQFSMLCKSKKLDKHFDHPTVAGGSTENAVILFNQCQDLENRDKAESSFGPNTKVSEYENAAGVTTPLLTKQVLKFWQGKSDAAALLAVSVVPSLTSVLSNCGSIDPKIMMEALIQHLDRHTEAHKLMLEKQLKTFEMKPGSDFKTFLNSLESKWKELENHGNSYDWAEKRKQLLAKMPVEFNTMRIMLLGIQKMALNAVPLVQYKEVCDYFFDFEEDCKQTAAKAKKATDRANLLQIALTTEHQNGIDEASRNYSRGRSRFGRGRGGRFRGGGRGGRGGGRGGGRAVNRTNCYNCGLEGHMSFNCPKPRPHCNHCDMDGHDDTNCWYTDEAAKVSAPAPAASSNPAAANFLADILGADFDDTEELPASSTLGRNHSTCGDLRIRRNRSVNYRMGRHRAPCRFWYQGDNRIDRRREVSEQDGGGEQPTLTSAVATTA